MRNLLAFLAAATLTLIGVGWYLDWFNFRSIPAESGHRQLNIDVNTEKISEDLHKAEQKVEHKLTEKHKPGTATSQPSQPIDPPPPDNDPIKKAIKDSMPKITLD